jgi:hypothetical protein
MTRKYAAHGTRGPRANDIYLKQIPYLIQLGQAKTLQKDGKLESYAFRAQP